LTNLPATTAPLRGVLLLIAAVLLFACMDTATKYLAALYAVPLIMAVRYGVNLLLMVVILGPRQGRRLYQTQRTGLVILRASCLVVASLFLGWALQRMPVAETTAIIFLGPMLVVLVARPLLGETLSAVGWIAVLAGFAGVLLIVRPGTGLDLIGVASLSVTVVATVAYNLLSRILARTESTTAMLFFTALAGSIAFATLVPFSLGGPTPTPWQLALLLSLGVIGGLGHFLFTAAFRYAPASLLAPINYLQLVWAGLLGWLVFRHVPDALTLVGMAIVAASGAMVAIRSARRPSPQPALVNEIVE
jgi:drug/metabolite transporter (DMT)-like permease